MSQLVEFSVDNKLFQSSLALMTNKQFTVQSVPRPYDVVMDDQLDPVANINALLAQHANNLLLIDRRVYEIYGQGLSVHPDKVFIADALEDFKTLDGVQAVLDFMQRNQFTKGETLVVVGGGIIQDVGAFVGACYKRGIRWVHFPTTLLAMCDSCIGGKTGINYMQAKNQIALFSSPHKVVINLHFLKTLSSDALQSGLGEILKLCITGGQAFLDIYERHVHDGQVKSLDDYRALILSALAVKRSIVEEDEFELHHRKSLNYGHTLGHVIESLSDYKIPHGIAVVIGMMLVNEMSCRDGRLSVEENAKLRGLCRDLLDEQVLSVMRQISTRDILDVLQKDKKVESKQISFVLLKSAGELHIVKKPLDDDLRKLIESLIAEEFKQ